MTEKPTVFELLDDSRSENMEWIGFILFCHLMIEQLLLELITHACSQKGQPLGDKAVDTFFKKVGMAETTIIQVAGAATPIIDASMADALRLFNKLRNRLAHTYGVVPTAHDIHNVVHAFGEAGVDFTDNFADSLDAAVELGYDPQGMLHEAVKHVFLDLGLLLLEAGGPDRIASPEEVHVN